LAQSRFSFACFAALEPSKDYNPWQAAYTKITNNSPRPSGFFRAEFCAVAFPEKDVALCRNPLLHLEELRFSPEIANCQDARPLSRALKIPVASIELLARKVRD
jgi:hypothetical protein